MLRSGFHILVIVLLTLVLGPVCGWLVGSLRGTDGLTGTTPILSASPAAGIVRAIAAMFIATCAGLIARALISRGAGLLAAGCCLAWAAAGTGTLPELIRARPGNTLPMLALESAILLIPGLFCAMVVGGRGAADPWQTARSRFSDRTAVLIGLALGVAAGLLCTWVVAQNALKGQTIASAAVAGLAAGIGACLISDRVTSWSIIAGFMLLAIVAPLVAAIVSPAGSALVLAASENHLLPAARLTCLDWLSGSLIGLSIGLSWGRGLVQAPIAPGSQQTI